MLDVDVYVADAERGSASRRTMASACETRDACRADANLARRARDVRARGGRRRHRLLRRRARRAGAQARVRGAGLAPLLHHMRLGGVACERAREDAEAVRGHILLPSNDNACARREPRGSVRYFRRGPVIQIEGSFVVMHDIFPL